MPEFRRISLEEWAQYPTKPAGKPDEWEDVMAALQAGEAIALTASDEKHLKGMRIGLGRRAKQRGIQLEYRSKDTTLAAQRIDYSPATSLEEEAQATPEELRASAPPAARIARGRRRT